MRLLNHVVTQPLDTAAVTEVTFENCPDIKMEDTDDENAMEHPNVSLNVSLCYLCLMFSKHAV